MFIQLDIQPVVCVSCGVCVDSCPTDVIGWSASTGEVSVNHVEDCQGCFLCVFDCPVDAISLKQVRVPLKEIGVAWQAVDIESRPATPS